MDNNPAEVNKPAEGVKPEEGGEPSTPQEKVASPEVKLEVQPEVKPEVVSPEKDKEQVYNLNIALKQEREFRKKSDEKISQLESKLQESSGLLDRFRKAINPEEEKPATPQYITKEEAESYWQEKAKELERKQVELQQVEKIKGEISTLEKEWNGKDGRPAYKDQDVLQWQKINNKEYLTPREAFFEKHRDEIIDWEVKQRLAGKKPVINVEKPSGGEQVHQPQEKTPKTDQELRQAVEEAMANAEKEL